MSKHSLAEKLIQLRTAKGITQEEVAHALSVSGKTISKWETGASDPNLSMLAKLSKYYHVSTDALLGIRQEEKQSTESFMHSQFEGLDRKASVLKAFDIVRAIIPASFKTISNEKDDVNDGVDVLPEKIDKMDRSCISTHEFYDFVVNADDVNIAVMLMRNKADFDWLHQTDKQQKIAKLFAFLSDTDVLKICAFIHSTACSETFTADYIAKHTQVAEDKATEILDASCEVDLCVKATAHLATGETTVYESFGDGNILSLITLAYEHMCGSKGYNYNFNGRCKMIGGK